MTAPGGTHTVKLYDRSVDLHFTYESPNKRFISSSSRKSLIAQEQASHLSRTSNLFYRQKPSELPNSILASFEEFHRKLLSKKTEPRSPFRSKINEVSRLNQMSRPKEVSRLKEVSGLKQVPISFINLFNDQKGKKTRPSRLGAKKENKERQYQTPKKESSRQRGLQTVYSNKSPMRHPHSTASHKIQDTGRRNPKIQNTCASSANFTRQGKGRQIIGIRTVIKLALTPRRV